MSEQEFKEMFKKLAYECLSVSCKEKTGNYGEKWIEVSLLFEDEVINTEYIDIPS